ncbi:serine hydrolase domain-containing protein [Flavimaricola marinus]|uniref:Penicillin-binding protein 4 n=1 Tax=Flavimaricola marinus TaxID=1819565 RepID=A0A238LFG1_9RHOB|nr:serine hydrolase [Flavimaricola marinus]SMY08348.1 Penicillin-binding protein 4* [Flavimaricola marinus]
MAALDALTGRLAPPFAFAAVGIRVGASPSRFHIATAPGLAATERTMYRVASISKIVTGQTLMAVAGGDLDRDIGEVLGFALRNPAFPDQPITLAHVLSHSAGLTDAAGYLIPPGVRLQDWLAETSCFTQTPPGQRAEYCNLGYILVAAAAEALGGARFDELAARHVLGPLGMGAGFNWSGVPAPARRDRLATYRRDGDSLIAQIDDAVADSGVCRLDGSGHGLSPYRWAQDVTQFSAQGGLRASLADCLTLAQALPKMDATALWSGEDGRTPVFESYGAGLQIFDAPEFYPRPLIGHFANAYGFIGGVWYDAERDLAFTYGLNGLPLEDDSDQLRAEELAILDAIAHSVV